MPPGTARVTGITISQHQASFLLADAMDMPFGDAAFAIEPILHMPGKDAVFGHLVRVLPPGAGWSWPSSARTMA